MKETSITNMTESDDIYHTYIGRKDNKMKKPKNTQKSDSAHHFFRDACTKSGSLRFSQFSGC